MCYHSCASAFIVCSNSPPTLPLHTSQGHKAAAFAIAPNITVTALHTVRKSPTVTVANRSAKLLKADPFRDLALLQLESRLRRFTPVALSIHPVRGGQFVAAWQQQVARLTLHAIEFETLLTAAVRIPLLVLHDQSRLVRPGWSGAPICDEHSGEVVGVITQVVDDEIVHAVPSRFLQLLTGEQSVLPCSYIPAIGVQPLDTAEARLAANVTERCGVRVAQTKSFSELQVGDVITAINGTAVEASGHVLWYGVQATWQAAVCELAPGELVKVDVERNGKKVSESVIVRDTRYALGAIPWMGEEVVTAGGAVFVALSFELLMAWGENWLRDGPSDLVGAAFEECNEGQTEVVVLVGCDEESEDVWDQYRYLRVVRVDGVEVKALKDLAGGESNNLSERMVVEFANGFVVAVPRGRMQKIDFGQQLQEQQR